MCWRNRDLAMTNPVLVEVVRGTLVESAHRGAVAVVDAGGATVLALGDVARPVFPRSAVKPLQALPLVEAGAADRFGFGDEELALASAPNLDRYREALADCVEESERVLNMLNTLMDITEAEAGMMKLKREPVDLCQIVQEAVELYEYVAEEKRISVRTELSAPCEASVDKTRIRQVFANLLDNAVKYTPRDGTVNIRVACRNGEASVIFRDTGIGIPLEEQNKIWTRLYRGDKSRSQRGLGLGLSLVKAVVEAHGGSVEVHSEPDKGAEFIVRLGSL